MIFNIDLMTLFAYAIAVITVFTMIFGIYAYSIYKAREIQNKLRQKAYKEYSNKQNKAVKKYLFFEQKELII